MLDQSGISNVKETKQRADSACYLVSLTWAELPDFGAFLLKFVCHKFCDASSKISPRNFPNLDVQFHNWYLGHIQIFNNPNVCDLFLSIDVEDKFSSSLHRISEPPVSIVTQRSLTSKTTTRP